MPFSHPQLPPPLQVSDMIFEQPLSDYYVAKILEYSPRSEFFMQFLNDLKILVDTSPTDSILDIITITRRP